MRKLILVSLLTFAPAASANDYSSIVAEAFANLDAGYRDRWAYSETATEEGVTVVGRYDPRHPLGSRWALISIDGRQPTAEELEDYLEEKEDDQGNERNEDNDASDFVDIESLELLEETNQYWLFDFTPNLDDEDDEARGFMDQVTGMLKVAKDGPYVQSLELRNEKPIKPAFGVRISRFFTRLTFGPAATGGPIVPKTMDVQVEGRAAVLIRFDEAESIHYGDYEFAGS